MILEKEKRVFVRMGFTDMRKQINGLSAIIQELKPEGPFDGSYYVFCGKTRKSIKIVYWDKNGFCLWLKRLEQDSFPWPIAG
jgi:transposase